MLKCFCFHLQTPGHLTSPQYSTLSKPKKAIIDDEYRDKVSELPAIKNSLREQDRSSSSSEGCAPSTRDSSVSIDGPSLDEVKLYFCGLAGSPNLIARTSTEPYPPTILTRHNSWSSPDYDDSYSGRKMLFNIGEHPIIHLYDQGPREKILGVLQGLPWYRIDILRIGYYYAAAKNPVVVLVTIKPRGVTYFRGQDTVDKCRQILLDHNLDVHVEMMDGGTSYSADSKRLLDSTVSYQRIPYIGQSLGPQTYDKQSSGTLGLFLTIHLNGYAPRRCALTCSHVVFPAGVRDPPGGLDKPFNYSLDPTDFLMDQPSIADHESIELALKNKYIGYNEQLTDLIERRDQAQQGLRKPLTQKQLENIGWFQEKVQEINKTIQDTEVFPRTFGQVLSCSGITVDPRHNNTIDWALVSLDIERFDRKPENIVPRFNFSEIDLYWVNANLPTKYEFTPPIIDPHITEIMSFQEVLANTITDTNGFKTFRVLKHGRTTGWTAGASNELKSNIEREPGRITTEWCIVDLPNGPSFGRGGDSGSAVFSYEGRIVGFLHSALSLDSHGVGVTYITPIERVFQNIEETLGVRVTLD